MFKFLLLLFSGGQWGPRRARRKRSERWSRHSWSPRPTGELASFLHFGNTLWASDKPPYSACISMHTAPFPVYLVCMTDDHLGLLVLSSLLIQGPEGQRGPAGTRVSLRSVAASLLQFSSLDIISINTWMICSFPFTHTVFLFWCLQGDAGDRGAPGEKVWNQWLISPTEPFLSNP